MVAYFGPQSVSPSVIADKVNSLVAKVSGGYELNLSGDKGLKFLLYLENRLQSYLREAWKANQDSGDEFSLGIDDYLMGLANERDEAIYLLKQRLHGSGEGTYSNPGRGRG